MEVQSVLEITELEALAAERPLKTVELFRPNDFYGHAVILKRYCGLDPEFPLPGIVPHGPNSTDRVWDYEVNHELPFFLLASKYQQVLYSKFSSKPSVIIGSPFCYAKRLMAADLAKIEPHARGTVVFPIHSTHHVTTDYDRNTFMEFLGRLPCEFHPIHLCVYWRDIQLGRHHEYLKAGFGCTTAGHMYDSQFHFRLLKILASHKFVVTNEIGGASFYAAAAGRPVLVHRQEYRISAKNRERLAEASVRPNSPVVEKFLKSCSLPLDQLKAFQRRLGEYALGIDHLKTPEELKKLLLDLSSRLRESGPSKEPSLPMPRTLEVQTGAVENTRKSAEAPEALARPKTQWRKDGSTHPANLVERKSGSADTLPPTGVREMKQNENELRSTDIMIASYPRSGNTWMRLLLSDVILQSMGMETETELPINQDYIIPDIYMGQLDAIDPRIRLKFRLIKTHAWFSPIPQKTIYLFRKPADALCSYFHFHRRYEHLAHATKEGIDAFCKNHLKEWVEHLESYLGPKLRGNSEILFIAYEWMHEEPVEALRQAAHFIDLPVTEEMCRKAENNHRFQKHRSNESLGKNHREYFFRKGEVGSSSAELQTDTLELVERSGDPQYQRALAFQGAGTSSAVSSPSAALTVGTHSAAGRRDAHSSPRVLHLAAHDFGGAGYSAYRLHKGLQSLGFHSSMGVLRSQSGDPSVEVLPGGGPADRVFKAKRQAILARYPNHRKSLEMFTDTHSPIALGELPQVREADLVHLHWVAGLLDYEQASAWFRGKPVVWTLHDMNPFTGGCHYSGDCEKYLHGCEACPQLGSDSPGDLSREVWEKKKRCYERLTGVRVVTPSRWLGECCRKGALMPFEVEVIPYGLPVDVFRPRPKAEIRAALNIPEKAKVILFGAFSVLNERKGFHYLLECLEQLRLTNSGDVRLVTFGHLPEGTHVSSRYPVLNLGLIESEEAMAMAYNAADVFVLSSLQDNLPNTAIEALACGVPVVGFRVGGIPDIVDHMATGYLAEPKDSRSLAEGIEWILSPERNSVQLSARCRARATVRYDLELQARNYVRLYERMLSEPPASIQRPGALPEAPSKPPLPSRAAPFQRVPAVRDTPRITVVTPNYNQGAFLEKCIRSVVEQGYPNLEYMVFDAASTDNSVQVLRRFEDKIGYWVSEKDEGQSDAIHKGIERATGVIFNWINADDTLEPGSLFKIAEAYRKDPDAVGWVGACRIVDPEGRTVLTVFPNGLDREHLGHNWNGRVFYQPSCFLDLNVVRSVGGVNRSLHYCMDFELYLRVLEQGTLASSGEVWANALRHPDAKTQKLLDESYQETIRVQRAHGFFAGAENRHRRRFGGGRMEYSIPRRLWEQLRNLKATGGGGDDPLDRPRSYHSRYHLCFVGDLDSREALESVRHFAESVFPEMVRRNPHLQFHVFCKGADRYSNLSACPSVCVTERPRSLEEIFQRYLLFVYPLESGGSREELRAAAAYGLPVVTTPYGAAQLSVRDGDQCFVARQDWEFVEKCHQCVVDPPTWGNFSARLQVRMAEPPKEAPRIGLSRGELPEAESPRPSKKLVLVQGGFPSASATFILKQMAGLADRHFDIENWSTYRPEETIVHPEVVRYGFLEKTRYLAFPPGDPSTRDATEWVNDFCRLNGIDWNELRKVPFFHVHYGANFNALMPLFERLDAFVLVSFHGYDASRYFKIHGDRCYETLFRRASLITVPSRFTGRELIRRGCNPAKVRVHRCGVDLDRFRPAVEKPERSELTFLSVGRLVEKKGMEYSIRAFARLEDAEHAHYRIVGDGPLRPWLEELVHSLGIEHRVHFLGALDEDRVVAEMSRADIFVLTSITASDGDQEGLPVSLIEAHAMGLPVISSEHAGIPELVRHNATGFLAPEKDVDAVARTMQILLNDREKRDSFSKNARKVVEIEFDIRALNDRLAGYFCREPAGADEGALATTTDASRLDLRAALAARGWEPKHSLYAPVLEGVTRLEEVPRPSISVVVISWRLHPDTATNLRMLREQKDRNYELIFVDNGGEPGEFDSLRPYIHTRVRLNANTGAYLARNIGAVFAKAPILLFLDDDAIPDSRLLSAHLAAFEKFDIVALRGAVLPKTDNPLNSLAGHYYLGNRPFPRYADVEGNASYLADPFFQVGGWDDEINFGHGGVDLALRLLGVDPDRRKQIYFPEAVIHHDFVADEGHLQHKKERQNKSLERLLKKHPDYARQVRVWDYEEAGKPLILRRRSPTVTVAIVSYNRAETIGQAVESALNQRVPADEILVVDDGSTDHTAEIVAGFASPKIRYLRKEHSGAPQTRNRAIREAKGEFILWLDSDDCLLPHAVASHAAALKQCPNADVLYGDLLVADESLQSQYEWAYPDFHGDSEVLLGRLVRGNCLPNPGTMIRKSCLERVGGYDESFRRAHDYELWSRLAGNAVFKHCGALVCRWRIHADSLSAHHDRVDKSFEARVVKGLLDRCRPEHLFADIPWGRIPYEEARATAFWTAALSLLGFEDVPGAVECLKKSRESAPSREADSLLSLLEDPSGVQDLQSPVLRADLPVPLEKDFDESFYLSQYPEVLGAVRSGRIRSGWEHFLAVGRFENRLTRTNPWSLSFSRDPGEVPLVSVIIPCFNQAEYLDDAVKSVVRQTFRDWEILIVNDGSTDDTGKVARSLIQEHGSRRIQLLEKENGGLAEARNAGIRKSKGKYIFPLDADDLLEPTMIEECVRVLDHNPRAAIAYTDVRQFGAVERVVPSVPYDFDLLCHMNFMCCSSLYRREAFDAVGGYNPNMVWGYEDWDFWIGCGEKGFFGQHVPKALFLYRRKVNSMVAESQKHDRELKARIVLNHPAVFSPEQVYWAKGVEAKDPRILALPDQPHFIPLFESTRPSPCAAQTTGVTPAGRKVLFTMYGWNDTGGGTTFPKSVARELVQRGHRVSVFYASLKNDPAMPPYSVMKEEDDGVVLYGVYNRPALFVDPDCPEREIRDEGILERFREVLDEVQPEVVHFHNFHGLTFAMAREVRERGIPSCYTPHNYHLIDPQLYLFRSDLSLWRNTDILENSEAVQRNPGKRELYEKRAETTRKLLNEWVDLTLAVSSRQRELLVQHGARPDRVAVVHQSHASTDGLWDNPKLAEQGSRPLHHPLRIGFIGGVMPHKGVHVLAAAAQHFDSSRAEFHIYGFGSADYVQRLKNLDPGERVVFHGNYTHDMLESIARELDVAVVPSLWEDCAPLVLLELTAMRLPILGASIGGIPDFVKEGVNGFLYSHDSVESLCRCIEYCIQNRLIIREMRSSLRRPHSFQGYVNHLETVYGDLSSRRVGEASRYDLLVRLDSGTPRLAIRWEGSQFVVHSLALVNRELCLQLMDKGCEVSILPFEPDQFGPEKDPRFARIAERVHKPLSREPDLHVRHQWPPNFVPPPQGHWVMIQPWEYGRLPEDWIEPMSNRVDEIWVPSSHVLKTYLASGIPADRVRVIPNGVNTRLFHPQARPISLATRKKYKFLFLGGTIWRKGIDLLLQAYGAAFRREDDVVLVVKDMGQNSFYRGQGAGKLIGELQENPKFPEILYLTENLDEQEMPGLLTACDCLVHPYRGEGFGLPVLEAMACGLPVIVTAGGATDDFCTPETAYFIPSRPKGYLPNDMKLVGGALWVLEADVNALKNELRLVYEHPEEGRRKGQRALEKVRSQYTWDKVAEQVAKRAEALRNRPIRRMSPVPVPVEPCTASPAFALNTV